MINANSPQSPSRRIFFRKLHETSANTVTATIATIWAIVSMNPVPSIILGGATYMGLSGDWIQKKWKAKREEKENVLHLNPSYQNIWVSHTDEAFDEDKEFLFQAIRRADIILLERGEQYFKKLEKYAKSQGKKVIYIDNPSIINVWVSLACSVAPVFIAWKNIKNHKELKKLSWIFKQTRRNIMALIIGLNWYIFTYPFLYGVFQGKKYIANDLGYITDARTIFMLQNILDIARKESGKNLLSITGDAHAKWIEYYLYNNDEFEVKRKCYNTTYGLMEGWWYEAI